MEIMTTETRKNLNEKKQAKKIVSDPDQS